MKTMIKRIREFMLYFFKDYTFDDFIEDLGLMPDLTLWEEEE